MITYDQKSDLKKSALRKILYAIVLALSPLIVESMATLVPAQTQEHLLGYVLMIIALKLLSVMVFGLGLADHAQSKGHSRWYGLIVLVPFVGIFWTLFLPDKWNEHSYTVNRLA